MCTYIRSFVCSACSYTKNFAFRDWASKIWLLCYFICKRSTKMDHSWQSRCATFTLRYRRKLAYLHPFLYTATRSVSFRRTPSSKKLAQGTTHRRCVGHHIRTCHGIQHDQCRGPLPGHSYYYIVRLFNVTGPCMDDRHGVNSNIDINT